MRSLARGSFESGRATQLDEAARMASLLRTTKDIERDKQTMSMTTETVAELCRRNAERERVA